jgi:hypothetical protein
MVTWRGFFIIDTSRPRRVGSIALQGHPKYANCTIHEIRRYAACVQLFLAQTHCEPAYLTMGK